MKSFCRTCLHFSSLFFLETFWDYCRAPANLTGNIAVTADPGGINIYHHQREWKKDYWSHIFWTPGVPLPLRIIILPVEIVGIFTKPISLTIRLFVAITAGHIVLLSLICLGLYF